MSNSKTSGTNTEVRICIWVHRQSESGKAIECSTAEHAKPTFWLPKNTIRPIGKVHRNAVAQFIIPRWLFLKHRQLCGDEAFEAEKQRCKGQVR